MPVEEIVSNWASTAVGRWVLSEVKEFLVDTLESHFYLTAESGSEKAVARGPPRGWSGLVDGANIRFHRSMGLSPGYSFRED